MHGYLFIYPLNVVVTLSSTQFNIQNSTLRPQFMRFAFVSEQTGIISLHSSNWLVAITKMVFTTRYEQNL